MIFLRAKKSFSATNNINISFFLSRQDIVFSMHWRFCLTPITRVRQFHFRVIWYLSFKLTRLCLLTPESEVTCGRLLRCIPTNTGGQSITHAMITGLLLFIKGKVLSFFVCFFFKISKRKKDIFILFMLIVPFLF